LGELAPVDEELMSADQETPWLLLDWTNQQPGAVRSFISLLPILVKNCPGIPEVAGGSQQDHVSCIGMVQVDGSGESVLKESEIETMLAVAVYSREVRIGAA